MVVCLSVRLTELRISKKLTQAQVAQYVGVTRGVISAYETDIRQPSYDIPKGMKDQIKEHAAQMGDKSANAFINRAISETMERDKTAKQ